MSNSARQFTALHWRFRDEFPAVWADDHAFALFMRLLVRSDQTWPEPNDLPAGYRKTALATLVDAGLVTCQPDGRYAIRGQKKERERRAAAARTAANARWSDRKDAS